MCIFYTNWLNPLTALLFYRTIKLEWHIKNENLMKKKLKKTLYKDIIRLRKNRDIPNIYDVEMENIEQLKKYDFLECHIVIYPYSRKISSENIEFHPFEEYVKDILTHHRSAYIRVSSHFNEIFGLFLGIIITILFAIFKREELFSIESIVSVFGAYIIGKELWDDIERMLVNISKERKIRYLESYYLYQLEKHTTLTYYSYLAKSRRYGKWTLLPEKMDFIQQSNSQTIRMNFNISDLRSFEESSAHILSIHIAPSLLKDFENDGFMFGVKLSFNKSFFGLVRCFELFQSLDGNSKGCLDEKGEWIQEAVFYRNTFLLGKLKYFMDSGLIYRESIIGF